MGLNKKQEIHAADWAYHKITSFNVDTINKKIVYVIATYKNREHRIKNENDYIKKDTFVINFSEMNMYELNDFRTVLYKCLKKSKLNSENIETNFFADADDVFEISTEIDGLEAAFDTVDKV